MASFIAQREEKLKLFINSYFSKNQYSLESMPGDAGMRSYYRVLADGKGYVVMDCPPDYANVQSFINVAKFLLENDFSAPQIIEQDIAEGFLIIEDFGTISIKNHFEKAAGDAIKVRKDIYYLIVDLLCSLQDQECLPGLRDFDNELLCKEIELFVDWYIPHVYKRELKMHEFDEFIEIWQNVLARQDAMPHCVVLRDYHLENMMYLEERSSFRKIGLLDFQDALCGSPVYDLVSVLEDARFDVPRQDALEFIDYFVKKKELDKEGVLRNYHILGAQRNCRILGVFARKSIRDNDDNYLKYIPRVQKYLEYDLSHPDLDQVREWLKNLK
jgi:aminoglycoside/choline kinase family phosphotransferase